MKARYIVYAVIVTIATTLFSWISMLSSSTNDSYGRGSSYSSGHSGGGSWGGGSGGHK